MKQSRAISPARRVTILMGTFNGVRHIEEQLRSIVWQTHQNWQLICSDDGSTDETLDILHAFAAEHPGQVQILQGPRAGFARNYLSMIRNLSPKTGFVAFADQDDIWRPDKLARAMGSLDASGWQPTLYCGRRTNWYPQSHRNVPSRKLHRPFTLQNALIENVAFGNTIVLNPAAARRARKAAQRTETLFSHDWWLYLLICASGGAIHFDNGPPQILYRQHGANLIGAGIGLYAQTLRKIGFLRGLLSERIQLNLDALEVVDDLLTPEARRIIADFRAARQAPCLARLVALQNMRPYRQHWPATLGFWGAASLGRI